MIRSLLLKSFMVIAILSFAGLPAHAAPPLATTSTTSTSLEAAPPDAALSSTPCAQPVSSGSNPTASDCLFILKTAVGSETCSPQCICAPKGTLPTSASDALLCLKKAVGQSVALACPCETTTTLVTTTTLATTTTTIVSTTTTAGGPSIERGRADYDARCAYCHSAGAYDPEAESANNLAGKGDNLVSDLGTLDGEMDGLLMTSQEQADMAAFLDSLE